MLRLWLNSLFALLAFPAIAQDFGGPAGTFAGQGPSENINFQILVLGGSSTTNINSGDPTIASITTNGGSINDVAVATCSCVDSVGAPATCAITGPAGISAALVNQTSGIGRQTVYYWVGTAANIGTTATCTNPGANTGSTTSTVLVFRGVNPTSVTDATTTLATNAASTNPNPAAIVPVSDLAAVMVTCSAGVATTADAAVGDVTNYATTTPGRQSNAANDTGASATASTWRIVSPAASEDPAAWSAWATSAWACATIALRPWR